LPDYELNIRFPRYCLSLLLVILVLPAVCVAVDAPRNPNSAKECAICHYRWIDTFFVDGTGSELVPYQAEPVVATAGMCFSCHDGSVVDSRSRVYNDHRHQINKPPPPGMKIPEIFPLDKNGNMQCATCHTAHGVSSEMGIEKTIFLRASNNDSAMCQQCHTNKDGGPKAGNHPVNTTAMALPAELLERGAVLGAKKNQVICETCHTVHGSTNERFLIASAKDSGLCIICHKDKAAVINSEHDLRITAPEERNGQGRTVTESGVCGTCHRVHGGGRGLLWARTGTGAGENVDRLCNDCHSPSGPAAKKVLTDHSHPVNLTPASKGLTTKLPLYAKDGSKSATGVMSCPTCHDPHRWDPLSDEAPGRNLEGDARNSFLRLENSPAPKLCSDCHAVQALAANTDHDLVMGGSEVVNWIGQTPRESGVCGVCHQVHGGQGEVLWARSAAGSGSKHASQDMCDSCHVENGVAAKKLVGQHSHPLNLNPAKSGLTTTLPLYSKDGKKTERGLITCQTCHDPHRWSPTSSGLGVLADKEGNAQNSFLRLENSPAPKLCGDCHAQQALVRNTDHDLQITAPEARNLANQTAAESGACGVCHQVHNAKQRVKLWARDLGPGDGVLDKMCRSCHGVDGSGKAKIPQAATHPRQKLVTNVGRDHVGRPDYFPLYNNRTGAPVKVGDIACASCHDVHQWNPRIPEPGPGHNEEGTAVDSFLRLQTFNMVCMDCHGFDALFRFKYYHESKIRGEASP